MANKTRMLALGLVVAAGSFTACGGGGGGGGKLTAACNDNLAISDGFNQLFSGFQGGPQSGPPSDAQKQEIKTTFSRLLAQPIADVEANAPDAIKADITAAAAQVRKLGETGDPSGLDDPAFSARTRRINLYFYGHCSGPKQVVVAVDYRFTGVPDRLPSGVVQLKLTNSGTEEHEMQLVRRKAGVTETYEQLLALPRDQARSKVDIIEQTSASPGKPDATVVHLSPGQYIMICTVSKGTVGDKQGDGPPHFTLGMKHEFTVT